MADDAETAFLSKENEDYYGEYTYWGTENLSGMTTTAGPSAVDNVANIDDNADVILYLPLNSTANNAINATGATAQDYEIKHITGKQLKSNNDKLNASNLEVQTLGTFSSDVDNLMRSTVIAVEYKLDRADWLKDTAGLISNANYGSSFRRRRTLTAASSSRCSLTTTPRMRLLFGLTSPAWRTSRRAL